MRSAPPALAVALTAVACRSPLLEPPAPGAPGSEAGAPAELRLEPAAELGAAPSVFRLVAPTLALDALRLYAGPLSAYHEGRVARGEPPATLEERAIPLLGWVDAEAGESVVAPLQALAAGETWTLAELGVGARAVIRAAPDAPAAWERAWPAPGVPSRVAVHCGSGPEPRLPDPGWLEPIGAPARLVPLGAGGAAEACVALVVAGAVAGQGVPPLVAEGAPLAPTPVVAAAELAEGPPCDEAEIAAPHACARVEDDRVRLRARHEALFRWGADQGPTPRPPGAEWLVRGFLPGGRARLALWALDLGGAVREQVLDVPTAPARPRLRFSEVLANAVGAEPAQEWVELINDGGAPGTLAGVTLVDTGAATSLPAIELAPGERVLVVGEAFAPGLFDVAPAPGTRLVRVPALGKSGLSNAGEPLALVAADGAVLDAFPGLPADEPGVSWARLDPDLPAVAPHGAPGASPGAANAF